MIKHEVVSYFYQEYFVIFILDRRVNTLNFVPRMVNDDTCSSYSPILKLFQGTKPHELFLNKQPLLEIKLLKVLIDNIGHF